MVSGPLSGKVLCLDVDGVVVTGRPDTGERWDSRLDADLGLAPTTLQERFFAPHWADIVRGRADIRPVLEAALRGTPVRASDLLDYWHAQDSGLDLAVLDDVARLRAAGWQVWLATNQDALRMGFLMDRLGLGTHVDGVFCSAKIGAAKPEPAFFMAIETELQQPPEALTLVDDSPANTAAARARGWHGVDWPSGAPLSALL